MKKVLTTNSAAKQNRFSIMISDIVKDYQQNKVLVFMAIPIVLWYIIFHFLPMYGIVIAFQEFNVARGISESKWVGLKNFNSFFSGYYSWRIIRNTLLLSFYKLIYTFPVPIILALLLNELRHKRFMRLVQTVTYLPHFISTVVICGMLVQFLSINGPLNNIVASMGGEKISFLLWPQYFRTIYVSTAVWQTAGWSSIIYLASLSGIDPSLYEAATIDGAKRFKQLIHVTLPGIAPTIIILLILNTGKIMSEGAEKVILLYNENTYDTADIIASFVYRRGIINADYSYSTAVGLFNSAVNLCLLATANFISRRVSETSLW